MRLDSGLTVNQRLAVFRRLCGFSQARMAELIGMKTSTYSQMERRGKISTEMVFKLSEALGVDPIELFMGTDYKKKETEKTETQKKPEDTKDIEKEKIKLPVYPPEPITMVLTPQEESIITIIRNTTKPKREEILEFIEKTAGFGKRKKKV